MHKCRPTPPLAIFAMQLVDFSYGNGLEVALGGGRSNVLPNTTPDPEDTGIKGGRKDGLDLTQQWLSKYSSSGLCV